MIRTEVKFLVSAIMAIALVAESRAGVSITVVQGTPTNLAGYTSFDLTAVADAGVIMAMDFDSTIGNGFFGPMNQIGLPDFATVFSNDMGELLALAQSDPTYGELLGLPELGSINPSQDSHFTVNTSKLLFVGAKESDDTLEASFALANPAHLAASANWAFAHIVVPNGQSVNYAGDILVYPTATSGGNGEAIFHVAGTLEAPGTGPSANPEPSSLCLLAVGCVIGASRRRSVACR